MPVLGNLVGAAVGWFVGATAGLIVGAEATLLARTKFNVSSNIGLIERGLAMGTLLFMAGLVGGIAGFHNTVGTISMPAALGVAHTAIAGPLLSGHGFAGSSGQTRRRMLGLFVVGIAVGNFIAATRIEHWPL